MDISDSPTVAASTLAAARAPSRRQASWLQAIGCGALGLVIGYSLAVVATQASLSAAPLTDAASASRTIAPTTGDFAGVPATPSAAERFRVPTGVAAATPPAAPVLEATGAWTAPLPGGMEPCWAERPIASC